MTRATLAVILARGLATRLRADDDVALDDDQRAAAIAGAKPLMPIAKRPFLDYVLHECAEAGVLDVVFVISPDDEAIRRRYDDEAPPNRLRVRYAVQTAPRGTADALLAARDVVRAPAGAPKDVHGQHHFLMANADNLYPSAAIQALVGLDGPGLAAFEATALTADGYIEAERLRRFALLDLGPDNALRDIAEKPEADHPLARASAQWVSMNLWRFTDRIFDHCAAVRPSPRGELELVDAVRAALAAGERFTAVRQRALVPDLTHRRDVPALERLLAGHHPRP